MLTLYIIDVPEAPGVEGLRAIVNQIKRSQTSPWDGAGPPIVLRGTSRALALMRLCRLDQVVQSMEEV